VRKMQTTVNMKPKYRSLRKNKIPTSPEKLQRAADRHERRQTALNLRMAGASYQQIVEADIGYKSTAHVGSDMRGILRAYQYETPEDILVLDLARLDDLQQHLTLAFHAGKYEQAGMILRVMQFRRETLGITPEVIEQRRNESKALVNNGIMVVQGSQSDYLKSMMEAAGTSPQEQQRELDRIAASNRTAPTEVVDAEIVEDDPPRKHLKKPKKLRKATGGDKSEKDENSRDEQFPERLENFIVNKEQLQSQSEEMPSVPLTDPVLSVDVPDSTQPQKKRLRIRVKPDDANMDASHGVPYRNPPRKPSESVSEQRILKKLPKQSSQVNSGLPRIPSSRRYKSVDNFVDEIESETLSQRID
jgi:hypothetical protein